MPVPDFQSIMLPLLKITTDGQEHTQGEIKDKLALQFQLNDIDQEEKLPGGGLRFDNNVAWSVVYLRKAGLLENSKRGIFHITEQGREILKNNPTKIDIKYLKQYPSFREWQEGSIKIKTNDPSKNGKVVVNPRPIDIDEEDLIYSDPSEIDPKNTPSYWIFQANPKYYDLAGAAKELKEISWKINRYKEEIHVGDIVYLWEAGNNAGIVAIGKIASIHAAITTPNEEMKFVRGGGNRDEDLTPFYGARVSIEPVLFDRIEKQTLLSNPVFKSMHILRQPQGTNFKVTYEEGQALNDLICGGKIEPDTPDRFYEDTGIDKESLERWVKAIKRKGQVIFYGPPGTGKTYLAERLAKYLISEGDGFKDIIQFHSAYAYEDFIQGIRPQPREDGTLNYPIVRGRFLEFCDRAKLHQGICVLIIDEINRANLARVFGELMYLLEYRDREMNLSGGGTLKIPSNVRIIGTMNTADRSIALVDHALRRRFAFLSLSPDYKILRQYHQRKASSFPVEDLIQVLTRLNSQLDRYYQVGITFFLRDNLNDEVEDIWKMEILPYLEEYFCDQPEKVDEFSWKMVKEKIGL